MSIDDTPSPQQNFTDRQPQSRKLRLVLIVAAIPLIAFAALWFGPAPAVPNQPKKFVRDGQGELKEVGGDNVDRPLLEVHAGKIEASNSFGSSSTTTHSGDARFRFHHIAVFNHSDHLLMKRVSADLLKEFRKLDYVNQLEFYPKGHKPAVGEMAPDVYVTLDLREFKESGFLIKHEIDAKIDVRAGRAIARGNASYIDHLSPPIVEFSLNGTLQHKSTTTGLSSSAAKYKLAAANIAKQIVDKLDGDFKKWIGQRGLLPEIPKSFYPEYEAPLELKFLREFDAELMVSAHGFMTRNESMWRFVSDRDAKGLLTKLRDQLVANGWKLKGESMDSEFTSHVRLQKGSVILMVFPKRKNSHSFQFADEHGTQPQAKIYYAQYTDYLTGYTLHAALQTILDTAKPSIGVLMMFHRNLSSDQRKQLLELFKQRPPKSVRAWLACANLHRANKENDQSRAALVRAWYLLGTIGNRSDFLNKIRESWKQLDSKQPFQEPKIDDSILQELGFVKVEPGKPLPETVVELDEPMVFYGFRDDGGLTTYSFRIIKLVSGLGMSFVSTAKGTRSWSNGHAVDLSRPLEQSKKLDGIAKVQFEIVKLPNENRFQITGTVHPIDASNDE